MLSIIAPCALVIGSLLYASAVYKKDLMDYKPYYPINTLTKSNWWESKTIQAALYSKSRLGKAKQPLNLQWLGNLYQIRDTLSKQGWQIQQGGWNWARLLQKQVTFIPKLFLDKPPVLVMTKELANKKILIVELWYANVNIKDAELPIWLGTVHFYIPSHKLFALHHSHAEIRTLFQGAIPYFIPELNAWKTKATIIPREKQPKEMQYLYWDGDLLLIQPKP